MPRQTSKYTPERVKRVLEAISAGTARCHAAAYGGIDHDTLNNWEKRYPEFKTQVLEAESRAVVAAVVHIRKAGQDGDWRADAWWLERRYPEEYGRTVSEQRHSGTITLLTADQLQELSDDEFSAYQARLREGPGGSGGGTAAPRLRIAESS